MVHNWFQVALAVMNLGAAATYLHNGNPKLAIVMCFYAGSCVVFATLE